jgi:hypothetical protein
MFGFVDASFGLKEPYSWKCSQELFTPSVSVFTWKDIGSKNSKEFAVGILMIN